MRTFIATFLWAITAILTETYHWKGMTIGEAWPLAIMMGVSYFVCIFQDLEELKK